VFPYLQTDGRTDRQTDELIWEGLGNLRFLQVNNNSLTPKCILVGTNNFLLEDFLLAKHTSHKHLHHDEPFFCLAAWFPSMNTPHPRELLRKGLGEAAIERFIIKLLSK